MSRAKTIGAIGRTITMKTSGRPRTRTRADYVFSENYETQMELAQERMNAWRNGEWEYIGVRAVADIKVPYGRDWITTRIKSPGLWGIESDAGADYLAEVFEEEKATLFEMLASLKEFERA